MEFEVALIKDSEIFPVPDEAGLLIPALAALLHPKLVPVVRLEGI